MATRLPRVVTITPGRDFLGLLAEAVLQGFPLAQPGPPLSTWTILLPTRRAARLFGEILRQKSGATAMVLPRIKPIGDLDEDWLQDESVSGDLPPALSRSATLMALFNLAKTWAMSNAEIEFAREIASSPVQCLNLARSLAELVETMETQEFDFSRLEEAYDADLSEHRTAILGLLALLSDKLPALHQESGAMGVYARRSKMIRLEAKRIEELHRGPIIAAGSTGTIPATRALLAAIARHAQGAVVLPGLDLLADDASWDALPPEHPQFALKQVLAELEVRRSDVATLGPAAAPRQRLASEMLRPTATAERWHYTLPPRKVEIAAAMDGLHVIAAPDRHIEARSIALLLRETLEHPGRTATLVTPNTDLATRVAAELKQWNIAIGSSAGLNLSRVGAGRTLDLLLEAVLAGFSAESVMAFLHDRSVSLGQGHATLERSLQNLEIVAMRGTVIGQGDGNFASLVATAHHAQASNHHAHPLVKALTTEDWAALQGLATRLDALLAPLKMPQPQGMKQHLALVQKTLQQFCSQLDWTQPVNAAVSDFLEELGDGAAYMAGAGFIESILMLQSLLRMTPAPPTQAGHPRLAILGTLEARLMPTDVLVLGGLNETVWPAQTDPGAWLNRTMREKLGLPQPERDIGLAAHDFEQGFAYPNVTLTFAARLGGAPAAPSRWVLRLKTVLDAAGVSAEPLARAPWVELALALGAPHDGVALQTPVAKPAPTPPVAARPRKFSVTEIERLVRNPYAIYARRILDLEPLPAFGAAADAALRGSLFHDAIALWNAAQAPGEQSLLAAGEGVFKVYPNIPEIQNFWWPHFRRVATWLAEQEEDLKKGLLRIHSELTGRIAFDVNGENYTLSARADRIDVLANGSARLIDYKTGKPPSTDQIETGLSPQLTLETAILLHGGFANLRPGKASEALYLRIAGGLDGLARQSVTKPKGPELESLAQNHLAGLKMLLVLYQLRAMPYLPRLRVFKEEDAADYDHLSRYREWQLAQEP